MRFVNNEALGVAGDPFGPFTATPFSVPIGNNVVVINAPASGFMTRVRAAGLFSATNALNLGIFIRIELQPATGQVIIGSYAQANGINIYWSGDITTTNAIQVTNGSNSLAAAGGVIWYRLEPIPQ